MTYEPIPVAKILKMLDLGQTAEARGLIVAATGRRNGSFVIVSSDEWEWVTQSEKEGRAAAARLRRRFRRVPAQVRAAVTERGQGNCRYCGANEADQMDHFNPEGPETVENLVLACRTCNVRKGRRPPHKLNDIGMSLRPVPGLSRSSHLERRPLPNGWALPRQRLASAVFQSPVGSGSSSLNSSVNASGVSSTPTR